MATATQERTGTQQHGGTEAAPPGMEIMALDGEAHLEAVADCSQGVTTCAGLIGDFVKSTPWAYKYKVRLKNGLTGILFVPGTETTLPPTVADQKRKNPKQSIFPMPSAG